MKLIYFFIYSPLFPFPCVPFWGVLFLHFSTLLATLGGCCFCFFFLIRKRQRDTLLEDWKMDQAGILRKFIQGVKAMSEGDEERGEDNFGSDFMVGQTFT